MKGLNKMKKFCFLLMAILIILVSIMPVFANELTDAINSKDSTEDKIEDVKKEREENQSKLNQAQQEKKYILHLEEEAEKAYNEKLEEIKMYDEEIRKYEESINEASERYEEKLELFKSRFRVMCKNTMVSYLQMLIESKSFAEFFERLQVIKIIVKNDNELLEEMLAIQKDYEFKQNIIATDRLVVQNELNDILRSLDSIKVSRADIDSRIDDINSKLNQLEWQLDELNRQAEELKGTINKLIKTKGIYVGGNMSWPLPACHTIVSDYGNRLHPIYKVYKMHTGIDIDGNYGDNIKAANTGTVILAEWQSGYGNTVVINHGGGITTLYGHCEKLLVKAGDFVEKGQTIAKVGSTGLSTGPHLHFEVRENGQTVNPLNYVSP